jgi:hypothetical protein
MKDKAPQDQDPELDEILDAAIPTVYMASSEGHSEPFQRHKAYARERLLAWRSKAVKQVLLKIKEEMRMHTVPEGHELITRHYLEKTIEFEIGRLTQGEEKKDERS